MLRTLALAALLASAAPAFALDCTYVSAEGNSLAADPGQVTITNMDGSTEACALKGNGPGNPVRTGMCDNGSDWPYFMISSEPDGPPDIVIFINTAWYEHCA